MPPFSAKEDTVFPKRQGYGQWKLRLEAWNSNPQAEPEFGTATATIQTCKTAP
jgi:hypothetical protein